MANQKLILIFLLGVMLLGCSPSTPVTSEPTASPDPENTSLSNNGQMLPISATAMMGGQLIELEVAKTPEQQAIGLMFRTELPKNRGMLFPFSEARYAQFWMKNVSIPLDMVFLKDGKIQAVFSDVPPCKADPCPVYGPATLIDQVIELSGGRAAELGLKTGDRITLEFQNPS